MINGGTRSSSIFLNISTNFFAIPFINWITIFSKKREIFFGSLFLNCLSWVDEFHTLQSSSLDFFSEEKSKVICSIWKCCQSDFTERLIRPSYFAMATSDNQDSLFADSSIVTPEVVQDSSPVPAPITTRRQLVGSKIQPWDILYSLLFATSAFFAVFLFTVCFIAVAFWCARRFCQGFSG